MKSFGSNFHTCNHVHHHGIHVRIHYYYTIKRKNFAQQREKREREEVGRKLARCCAIDKRKSGNVGWLVIIQAQDKSLIYNRSKFIYFNVAKRSIPHALIRLITRYQEFMSLLFFVFQDLYLRFHRGLLLVGLRDHLSRLILLISRQILICKYGKLDKYLNTRFGAFFESV